MGDEILFYHDVLEDEFQDEVPLDASEEYHTPDNSDPSTSKDIEIVVEDTSA